MLVLALVLMLCLAVAPPANAGPFDVVSLDGKSAGDLIGGPLVWTGVYRDRTEHRVVGQL